MPKCPSNGELVSWAPKEIRVGFWYHFPAGLERPYLVIGEDKRREQIYTITTRYNTNTFLLQTHDTRDFIRQSMANRPHIHKEYPAEPTRAS